MTHDQQDKCRMEFEAWAQLMQSKGWGSQPEVTVKDLLIAWKAAWNKSREWHPIETAPKDKTTILLYVDSTEETFVGSWSELSGYWMAHGWTEEEPDAPTHWQPLTKPSKLV